ncbi:MAG TPA: hypothetical protein VJH25_02480 [Candidatus Paceibacterota bacterium]
MKQSTIKTIQYELDIINRQIDMKIITGRSYKNDAIRHKLLIGQLRRLKSQDGHSPFAHFFGRMAGALATLVF